MTGPVLLLDANELLLDILKAAVAGAEPVVTVVDRLMVNRSRFYPLVRGYRWGGAAVDPRYLDRAICDVLVFDSDRSRATTLAGQLRAALFAAADEQTIFEHGSVSDFTEILAPMEPDTPNRPDGETLVQATYELHLCPPLSF